MTADILNSPEYAFLKTNPHLGKHVALLAVVGSHAYGTNVETSDLDLKGCFLNTPRELLGLPKSACETIADDQTDTTLYSFPRFISMMLECNPHTVELLGCRPKHYLVLTDAGKSILDHASLFLSQQAVDAFGHFASRQRKRLAYLLSLKDDSLAAQQERLQMALESSIESLSKHYPMFSKDTFTLRGETEELLADIHLDGVPVYEFNSMMKELNSVVKTHKKLAQFRGEQKNAALINKHAMHLVRLLWMGTELLETGRVVTYREKEHDLLMDIRRGAYMKNDGSYRDEFFEMVDQLEEQFQYAASNTILPEHPDMKQVEEFVVEINRKNLSEGDA